MRTAPAAIVTKYPTGAFGIEVGGSMFYWFGFYESEAHDELARLRLDPKQVRWEERYYDRRLPFSDPACYKLRKYKPNKT